MSAGTDVEPTPDDDGGGRPSGSEAGEGLARRCREQPGLLRCALCSGFTCREEAELDSHIVDAHIRPRGKPCIPCPYDCPLIYDAVDDALSHVEAMHPVSPSAGGDADLPVVKCLLCQAQIDDQRDHVKLHHLKECFECRSCDTPVVKRFESFDEFVDHFRNCHWIVSTDPGVNDHAARPFAVHPLKTEAAEEDDMMEHSSVRQKREKESRLRERKAGTKALTHEQLRKKAANERYKFVKHLPVKKCAYCNFTTRGPVRMNRHLIAKHVACRKCKFVGKTRADLDTHMLQSHPEALTCPFCSYRGCQSREKLAEHVKIHYEDTMFACDDCDLEFSSVNGLNRHILVAHLLQRQEGDIGASLPCHLCDFNAKSIEEVTRHVKTMHDASKDSVRCVLCDFVASDKTSLRQHETEAHGDGTESREQKCRQCDFRAENFRALRLHHDESHPGESGRVFRCDYCEFSAKQRYNLVLHIKRHFPKEEDMSVRERQCPACSVKTNCMPSYTDHFKESHRTDDRLTNKLLKCPDCDFSCVGADAFTQHVEAHVAAVEKHLREYRCQLCEFSSTSQVEQRRHLDEVHGGSMAEHQCQYCDFRSSRRWNFRMHMQRHGVILNGVRIREPYQKKVNAGVELDDDIPDEARKGGEEGGRTVACMLCNFKSSSMIMQRRHLIEVHGGRDKVHRCWKCDSFATTHRYNFKMHMMRVHNVDVQKRTPEQALVDEDRVAEASKPDVQAGQEAEEETTSGHSGEKRRSVNCMLCRFTCANSALHKIHLRRVHGGLKRIYKCWKCDTFATPKRYNFRTHMLRVHRYDLAKRSPEKAQREDMQGFHQLDDGETEELEDEDPDRRRYNCLLCNYRSENSSEQRRHINEIHGGKDMVHHCWVCNSFSTSHRYNFNKHMMTQHNVDLTQRSPEEAKVDDEDVKMEVDEDVMAVSTRPDRKSKKMQCDKCHFSSTSKANMKEHMLLEHEPVSVENVDQVYDVTDSLLDEAGFAGTSVKDFHDIDLDDMAF